MITMLTGLVMALSPILIVVALLVWAEWRDRRREATVARQIRLTDAIAAELGAIVAPVVKRPLWGPWQIELAMPLGRPAMVGRVLAIAHRVLPGRYEIVVTPQAEPLGVRPKPAPRLRAA